jgi:hypothetical protein
VAERPRDRTTVLIGWLTVFVMVVIATIFLVTMSPWNDPHPRFHPKKVHSTRHH